MNWADGTRPDVMSWADPTRYSVTGRVLLAEPADVDAAVRSGVEAFAGWSQQSLSARSKVLFAFTGVAGRQCAANC
jgi:malonate-semialdehyde dehydrogenase (acetylating)/methylmalonate-semialdehyde dehydrogenase